MVVSGCKQCLKVRKLLKYFERVQQTTFLTHNFKKIAFKTVKLSKLLTEFFIGSFIDLAETTSKTETFIKLRKQFQNNFEEVQKTKFWTPKWSEMTPQNPPKWAQFWQSYDFCVIYQPFELNIDPKESFLSPNKRLRYLQNNSHNNLKKYHKTAI